MPAALDHTERKASSGAVIGVAETFTMRGFCGAWRCIALSLVLLSYFMVYENLIVVERNPTSTDSEAGATPVFKTTATRFDFSQSSVGIGGMVGDGGSIRTDKGRSERERERAMQG